MRRFPTSSAGHGPLAHQAVAFRTCAETSLAGAPELDGRRRRQADAASEVRKPDAYLRRLAARKRAAELAARRIPAIATPAVIGTGFAFAVEVA